MVAQESVDMPAGQDMLFGEVRKHWGWLLALGILFIILGTIGLGMTFFLTLASVLFFGALLLVGGGVQLVDAFKCKGWKSILGHVLIALLYLAAGAIIIYDPVASSTLITAMLAGALIGIGIVRLFMAFQMRSQKGWGWLAFAGVISLVLGGMIMSQWPVSGLWVIGLFVAIEMIFHGWSYVFLALAARKAAQTV